MPIARVQHWVGVEQLALPGIAALAAGLNLVNLTISGWANTYYALAAQAASQRWSALFFGAIDAPGFITLDKPPLAILPMALSVRLLGLSSFSILLPEALLGVGTVVVLYLAVRRSFGSRAAIVAGLVAALTPVAVLIFRFDNPDALLTFLLVTAAYAMTRGLEAGRLRWALLAAALVGSAFLTKYLQAYLVLPGFALTWLLCAPVSLRRRIGGLVASLATVLLASGWWVAIMVILPASARPFIGGSRTNSVLDLIFGYDGLGRLLGAEFGIPGAQLGVPGGGLPPGAGPGATPSFAGEPGLLRLFNDQIGGQIAWLLPAALLAAAVGLVLYRRAGRSDGRFAGYVLWAGWLAGHVVVFSLMSGVIHGYYTVTMVPAIAALVGAGAWDLWRRRADGPAAGVGLGLGLLATGVMALILLERTPGFLPGLGVAILALAAAAALVVALPQIHLDPRISRAAIVGGLVVALAGPAAYSVATIAQAHGGGDVAAGPAGDGNAGDGSFTVNKALVDYLVDHRGSADWIVAVNTSHTAASIQLVAQKPVMAMGGFNGFDPAPTLEQLRSYVASGRLRYVLMADGRGRPIVGGEGPIFEPPLDGSLSVSAWVTSSCTLVTDQAASTGGLYDCAGAA